MPIYLDHNATTPVASAVREAMEPFFQTQWGNPSSLHRFGSSLRRHLESARASVAHLIGADPIEIVFTGCGTESNNLAIRGAWEAAATPRGAIVTSRVEHPSVREVCRVLGTAAPARARGARPSLDEREGEGGVTRRRLEQSSDAPADLIEIGVDAAGHLDLPSLQAALARRPILVSLMWANNETGVLFPIADIARLVKAAGALLHVDAVQAAGKIPIDLRTVPVDLLSLSGHKLNAPKGIGALFVRRGTRIQPQILGGGQEQGLRGGTPNVPYIAGFGAACELARSRLPDMARVRALRDRLEQGLLAQCPEAIVNGDPTQRLPNTLNIRFPGMEGESLLLRLDDAGIAISTGSACSSGKQEPSHVLLAMGLSMRDANSALRFSLGDDNTEAEIDHAIAQTAAIVRR